MPPYPMQHGLKEPRQWFSHAGVFMLLALLLGGGTRNGLSSDALLQLLALPLVWRFIMTFPHGARHPAVPALVLMAFALFAWQLLPWPSRDGWHFPFTVAAGSTLQSFLVFLVFVSLFWVLMTSSREQRHLAIAWMLAGVAANLVFSLLVFAGNNAIFDVFEWRMSAGFFANENHLSMLYVMAVPFLVAWFGQNRWMWLALLVVLFMVAVQFVVGSRAGMAMILAASVLSFAFVRRGSWWLLLTLLLLIVAAGWWAITYLGWGEELSLAGNKISRGAFWANTLKAIGAHWPWGSGFGTFVPVYAAFEPPEQILNVYVNRAHNDWLEVALEGGLPVLILIAAMLLTLLWRVVRQPLDAWQRAAALSLLFVMLHSIVDYPLRTMALSSMTALLLAILMAAPETAER